MSHRKKQILVLLCFIFLACAGITAWAIHKSFLSGALLEKPVLVLGAKQIVKNTQELEPGILVGKDVLTVSYDLQGVCILEGPASAISFVALNEKAYSISLSGYGQNCAFGEQTVKIPIKDFGIDQPFENIIALKTEFWSPTSYALAIKKVTADKTKGFLAVEMQKLLAGGANSHGKTLQGSRNTPEIINPENKNGNGRKKITPPPLPPPAPAPSPSPTPSPTPTTTPPQTAHFWSIRSVSSMKETKDKVCGQDSLTFINSWIDKAVELGINYIAVETPYDNPACGSSVAYTKQWVDAIHARGLNVWHRHAPLAFEGIYATAKDSSKDYLQLVNDYIKANPTFFQAGDIFSPIPEPQNGGISGITYCPQSICIFNGAPAFNAWLRDAISTSDSAFQSIGLGGKIKVGYYGFDGFVAWGDNNPDWHGILEDATIQAMGNITIDHYPEIVGDTMDNDLNELQAKYPNTPIIIGEWGTITGGDTVAQTNASMQAAMRPGVVGFNYWHLGMGGNESLINDDMSNKPAFDAVKSFFVK